MMAQTALSEPVERRVREIDAVADVAVAQIIHDLARGHDRALFLRLRRCGAEVREADDIFLPDELRVREVGHIARRPCPLSMAARSASSSTSSPRAKFKMRMPGFIFANVSAFR